VNADESGISNPANQFNLEMIAGSPASSALSSLDLVVANDDLGAPYISNLADPGTVSFTNQSLPASSGQGSLLVLYNSLDQAVGSVVFAITDASAGPVTAAPELDATSTSSGLTLLLGALAILRDRRADRVLHGARPRSG
jgi:hypothetical protein